MTADRQAAQRQDETDLLRHMRDEFLLPDGVIYLDGNSLGPLPRRARERVARAGAHEWGNDLIRSWNTAGWFDLHSTVGAKIARLIGAEADEVVAADSTSINLFKLSVAAARLRPGRRVILSDSGNFPTDLYIGQGIADLLGQGLEMRIVDRDQVLSAIDETVALVMLTEVDFRDGRRHDVAAVTAAAHKAGALMLWDLCHSAGALPVDLNGVGADLAVGCSYKYLNGGPGAPAFLFVARRLQADIRPPLSGWWGHDRPFDFVTGYRAAEGIRRNLCGTQPILSFSALDAALDLWDGVDMAALRAKSVALCESFIALVERDCGQYGLTLASPREAERRGSQVSFRHPEGYAIMQALIARGVIGDFRAPDVLRFGFAPLYIRHVDVVDAVAILHNILATGSWDTPEFRARSAVT